MFAVVASPRPHFRARHKVAGTRGQRCGQLPAQHIHIKAWRCNIVQTHAVLIEEVTQEMDLVPTQELTWKCRRSEKAPAGQEFLLVRLQYEGPPDTIHVLWAPYEWPYTDQGLAEDLHHASADESRQIRAIVEGETRKSA